MADERETLGGELGKALQAIKSRVVNAFVTARPVYLQNQPLTSTEKPVLMKAVWAAIGAAFAPKSPNGTISISTVADEHGDPQLILEAADSIGSDGAYDMPLFVGGELYNSNQRLFCIEIVRPVRVLANFEGSLASCPADKVPTADTVWTIKLTRAGVTTDLGTISWTAGSQVGVFSSTPLINLVAGDKLWIRNAAVADFTLANASVTFKVTRALIAGATVATLHNDFDGRTDDACHPATASTVNTASFSKNLSSADNTVQKALETIDQMDVGAELEVTGTGYVKVVDGVVQGAAATPTAADVGAVAANAAITGATKTKVTYDAKGLVTSGTDATTADINDSSNRRYCTDAQKTVIGNTSGTNTGDETHSSILTKIAESSPTTTKYLRDDGTWQTPAGGGGGGGSSIFDMGGPDVNPYASPKVGKQINVSGTTSFTFSSTAYLQNANCNGTVTLVKLSDKSTVATLTVTAQAPTNYTTSVSLASGIYEARFQLASSATNALVVGGIQLEQVAT